MLPQLAIGGYTLYTVTIQSTLRSILSKPSEWVRAASGRLSPSDTLPSSSYTVTGRIPKWKAISPDSTETCARIDGLHLIHRSTDIRWSTKACHVPNAAGVPWRYPLSLVRR